jgi:hypothetical protein
MAEVNTQHSNHIYGFVDVVAFSDFVKQQVNPSVIDALKKVVESYNEKVRRLNLAAEGKYRFDTNTFGDTVCFFSKCGNDDAVLALILMSLLRDMQKDFLMNHNIFIGGSIVCGPLCTEPFTGFTGEAMVLASDLEKKKKWFGVVVSDDIFEVVSDMASIRFGLDPILNSMTDMRFVICENVRYINYLCFRILGEDTTDASFRHDVERHRDAVLSAICRYKGVLDNSDNTEDRRFKVRERYAATVKYHNHVCSISESTHDFLIADSQLSS